LFATGKAAKVSWIGIYKLDAAGKVAEGWVEFDRAMVEMQLKGDMTKGK
jgi:predicted ester cyclase